MHNLTYKKGIKLCFLTTVTIGIGVSVSIYVLCGVKQNLPIDVLGSFNPSFAFNVLVLSW